ncbi:hypothetical protein CBR_g48469 [Chara braunii]|uniref:SHSP domain-containing protein n=1 Tax=Chara braunii TaxID=69332 RepID=A0A388M2Q2_CHABU|nr:hypothetical protein CBR_g48469 [Chara braunii]|eukprot:GBG88857.1 hypothetical protein CBR_g48469 [Chara braunii]
MGVYRIVLPDASMASLMNTLEQIADFSSDVEDDVNSSTTADKSRREYVKERQAMANAAVDVKETPTPYEFVADVPGLSGENVKVHVENGSTLVITGKRRRDASASAAEENGEKKQFKYLRMERRVGKFVRRFTLPEDAELDKIGAQCRNGLLTVTVPKVPPREPEKPKVIDIQIS